MLFTVQRSAGLFETQRKRVVLQSKPLGCLRSRLAPRPSSLPPRQTSLPPRRDVTEAAPLPGHWAVCWQTPEFVASEKVPWPLCAPPPPLCPFISSSSFWSNWRIFPLQPPPFLFRLSSSELQGNLTTRVRSCRVHLLNLSNLCSAI